MFYICHACQPNTIPTDSDGDNKRKKKKVSKDAAPSTSSQNRPEESPETETEDIVFLSTQDANNEEVNTRETKYQNQNQPNDATSKTKICRFYKNGNCKFGLKGKECKFTHPKMCRKYTQHGTNKQRGCNLGRKCKDFHPKMCFGSIRKGEVLLHPAVSLM